MNTVDVIRDAVSLIRAYFLKDERWYHRYHEINDMVWKLKTLGGPDRFAWDAVQEAIWAAQDHRILPRTIQKLQTAKEEFQKAGMVKEADTVAKLLDETLLPIDTNVKLIQKVLDAISALTDEDNPKDIDIKPLLPEIHQRIQNDKRDSLIAWMRLEEALHQAVNKNRPKVLEELESAEEYMEFARNPLKLHLPTRILGG